MYKLFKERNSPTERYHQAEVPFVETEAEAVLLLLLLLMKITRP